MMMIRGKVEKIVAGGWGLLRTPEGVVFCRNVIPGEEVEVEVEAESRRRGVVWSGKAKILRASADRVEPACPNFPACGGCDFQHLNYRSELALKYEMVRESLQRLARVSLPVADFDRAFLTLPCQDYRDTVKLRGAAGRLGFFRKRSKKLVPVENCLIASPRIGKEIRRWNEGEKKRSLQVLTIREGNLALPEGGDNLVTIAEFPSRISFTGAKLYFRLGGRIFTVSPTSFFQTNIAATELILKDLKKYLPPASRLLDLFAGVGLFSISLAESYSKVKGLEISRSAIKDFRENARGDEKIGIEVWNAEDGLPEEIGNNDLLLLDPPRTGLPSRLRQELSHSRPRALAYLSCDPATFARDLTQLLEGGYRLEGEIKLYDMFPRTAQVELLAILKK